MGAHNSREQVMARCMAFLDLVKGRRYAPSNREVMRAVGIGERSVSRYWNAYEKAGLPMPKRQNDELR